MILEEAENAIREAVKDEYFLRSAPSALNDRVRKIILSALENIRIPSLREAARRSLVAFYNRQRFLVRLIPQEGVLLLLALLKTQEKRKNGVTSPYVSAIGRNTAEEILRRHGFPRTEVLNLATETGRFTKDYFKKEVLPVLDRMAKERALDPDSEAYRKQRNTLRNRAELEVRYQNHLDNFQQMRERGTRLVIISAHADCSERCRPFQGRVFSLDGSSGTTDDGRKFEPIEHATDIYTPNGKWKNGLFGFNCRHYAVEYRSGYEFPTVSAETERRQYRITQRQRAMETTVRNWKIRAEMLRGLDRDGYRHAKEKAREWTRKYEEFSRANHRAYYPSRTKVL